MKRKPNVRSAAKTFWLFVMIVAAVVIAACAPNTAEFIISPNLAAQVALRDAGNEVTIIPTPTPRPLSSFSPEELVAGVPEDVLAEIPNVNTADADAIATKYGCKGCHSLDPAIQLAGPMWINAGGNAVIRKPSLSPGAYLYESISEPNAFIVSDFPPDAMPKDFEARMSKLEMATMIQYLLSQQGQ